MSGAGGGRAPYPAAPRSDLVDIVHGHPVADPYRWLERGDDPEVRRWMAAQGELWESTRNSWPDWSRLRADLLVRTDIEVCSIPRQHGTRQFHTRTDPGRDHPVLLVTEDGQERLLLDPQLLDASGLTVLDSWQASWEGVAVVIQLSAGGSEDSRLYVLDVASGEFVDGPIDRVRRSSIGWLPGGERFYYVRRAAPEQSGDNRYHRRVYLHTVGRPTSEDVLVHGDGYPATQFFNVTVFPANTGDSGPWLVLSTSAGSSPRRDVLVADLSDGRVHRPQFRPLQVGLPAKTSVQITAASAAAGTAYLLTTLDAPRGRIMVADLTDLERPWRELVAEDPDSVLSDFAAVDTAEAGRPALLLNRTRHAASELTVVDAGDGSLIQPVALPGHGVVQIRSAGQPSDRLYFSYEDPATARIILSYQCGTGEVCWPDRGAAPDQPCTLLAPYRSADGTEVWLYLITPSGTPDRPRPAILSGYGGFGASATPIYHPEALLWVESGGIFAFACVRGGGEEGAQWHQAGSGRQKQNTFDDFAAAARWLMDNGWTTAEQLGLLGSSNGGLLVGASITQHPELFAAAVCGAPLLDMVRYELSGMGPSWREEYGTAADPEDFAVLHSYSPYHAVQVGVSYPATMFAVFEGDSRVDLLHARKMCAAMQHADLGAGPIVLRAQAGARHGAQAFSSGVTYAADYLAFLGAQLGLALVPAADATELRPTG